MRVDEDCVLPLLLALQCVKIFLEVLQRNGEILDYSIAIRQFDFGSKVSLSNLLFTEINPVNLGWINRTVVLRRV